MSYDWIKPELFEVTLKQYVKNYENIISFSAKPPFAAGENYLSIMFAVEIVVQLKGGNTKKVSYMLKVLPESKQALGMIEMLGLFKREIIAYYEMLPAYEALYQQAGKTVKFGPDSFKLDKNLDKDIVLLEDLRLRGFKNVDRHKGLDMQHTKCALRKLAEYHAASATYLARNGAFPELYMQSMLNDEFLAFFEASQAKQNKKFNECMELYKMEHLRETVTKYQAVFTKQLKTLDVNDPNLFFVCSHGDFWSNNIMFQHDDEGNVTDTLLIDLQVSRRATPVLDLQYFLLSSTCLENKLKYFDYFVMYYHECLVENLKFLKYPKALPTLRDLHLMMFKQSCYAYTTILKTLPVVLLDSNAVAEIDVDNMMGEKSEGSAMQHAMYTNPNYAKQIEVILPWMANRGYFDVE